MTQQKKQPKPYQNPFEGITEFGKDTVKQVVDTLNPLTALENKTEGEAKDKDIERLTSLEKDHKASHTPLDFNKLDDAYKSQDQQKVTALQQRYFKRVKEEDERMLHMHKQMEEQKKRQELEQEQLKIQQDVQRKKQMQQQEEPHGKVKKNIFGGGKKKADVSREVAYENKGMHGR